MLISNKIDLIGKNIAKNKGIEIETRKQWRNIHETNSWFLEKVNYALAKDQEKRRNNDSNTSIKNEKNDSIRDFTNIKGKI